MSRHWKFKSITGPASGYYTITYENKAASTTAEVKLPEYGVYHGKSGKPMKKNAAERVGRRMKTALNKNT